MLYDHYQGSVFRFLFYRTRSSAAGRGPDVGDVLPGAAEPCRTSAGRARTFGGRGL